MHETVTPDALATAPPPNPAAVTSKESPSSHSSSILTQKPLPRFRRGAPSGGPRTPEGKANSSMNRLSHGCRSEKTIVPGEDPTEFEACMRAWFEAYGPQDEISAHLVEETALADWFLRRNRKRLHDIEQRLPYDAWLWTDENHKLFSNATRYKTTAERSFIRQFRELEAHLRRDIQDAQIYQRAIAQSARILTEWITRTEQSLREELRVQQWVEIEVKDGRTITTCSPSNEQVMKDVAKRSERPLFLTRTLNFPRGIPPEYDWACHTDMQQTFPCIARQTVLYSQWLDVIEREKSTPGGHLGPLDWLFDD